MVTEPVEATCSETLALIATEIPEWSGEAA